MQDIPSERELLALGTTLVANALPVPRPSEPMSASGLRRLDENRLDILSARYRKTGVGPVASGRMMLCAPDMFDQVFATLALVRPGDTVFALCYGSFGTLFAQSRSGNEVLLDPMTSEITIFEGEAEDDVMFQVTCATLVTSALEEARAPDRLVDLDGKDLHKSVLASLGSLRHGQCYASRLSRDPVERFRANSYGIVDVAEHILRRHAEEPFRITTVPLP
jgi:hypothetical protein